MGQAADGDMVDSERAMDLNFADDVALLADSLLAWSGLHKDLGLL